MKSLVIVESPTKARTISKFLGKDFKVESSFGHVRDLPKAKLGVDIENDYEPTYEVPTRAKKQVEKLKKDAAKASMIYFATDEDREGEAITWHLIHILKLDKKKVKRIAFHEITKDAILHALDNPREVDVNLVDAQQARRVLDRLVGYKLSPFLWKKVARGLSAGRVQSVAMRLIVEREKEIDAFKPQEYWTVDAEFSKDETKFEAKLQKVDGKSLGKLDIKSQKQSDEILKKLKDSKYAVVDITKKQHKKKPLAPFTTSTLQQAANHRLGYSAKKTMMFAQQLYEGVELGDKDATGLITYMRTDSVILSKKFLDETQAYIKDKVGEKYTTGERAYKGKSKLSQEAHEAIRPTDVSHSPDSIKDHLSNEQFRLYQLIWQRAVASQMADALIDSTSVDINDASDKYTFRANGSIIAFDGWLKVLDTSTKENILPDMESGQALKAETITPNQHFTQPPARFSEATLVKELEERGIGRPSTYAPTISTLQDRNYIEKIEKRLKPTDIAVLVNDVLVKHFPSVTDYDFTARMEDDLDKIAHGKLKWQLAIDEFYQPFEKRLEKKDKEVSKKELTEEETDEVCDKCSQPMVIKVGRYGRFLACTGYPDCKNTKQLDDGKAPAEPEFVDEKCPECSKPLVKRKGRYGEFIGCSNYPKCKYIKKEPSKKFADCPKCGKGGIVTKRSKRGVFYACDQYPDCKNAYWSAPTGKKCPDCSSLLIHGKNDTVVCSSKECKHTE